MAQAYVYWVTSAFDFDQGVELDRVDRTFGVLTDEHEDSIDGMPVLIEEVSGRVYVPGDLPPNTVIYVEESPGDLPPIAEKAIEAGYLVRRA